MEHLVRGKEKARLSIKKKVKELYCEESSDESVEDFRLYGKYGQNGSDHTSSLPVLLVENSTVTQDTTKEWTKLSVNEKVKRLDSEGNSEESENDGILTEENKILKDGEEVTLFPPVDINNSAVTKDRDTFLEKAMLPVNKASVNDPDGSENGLILNSGKSGQKGNVFPPMFVADSATSEEETNLKIMDTLKPSVRKEEFVDSSEEDEIILKKRKDNQKDNGKVPLLPPLQVNDYSVARVSSGKTDDKYGSKLKQDFKCPPISHKCEKNRPHTEHPEVKLPINTFSALQYFAPNPSKKESRVKVSFKDAVNSGDSYCGEDILKPQSKTPKQIKLPSLQMTSVGANKFNTINQNEGFHHMNVYCTKEPLEPIQEVEYDCNDNEEDDDDVDEKLPTPSVEENEHDAVKSQQMDGDQTEEVEHIEIISLDIKVDKQLKNPLKVESPVLVSPTDTIETTVTSSVFSPRDTSNETDQTQSETDDQLANKENNTKIERGKKRKKKRVATGRVRQFTLPDIHNDKNKLKPYEKKCVTVAPSSSLETIPEAAASSSSFLSDWEEYLATPRLHTRVGMMENIEEKQEKYVQLLRERVRQIEREKTEEDFVLSLVMGTRTDDSDRKTQKKLEKQRKKMFK